MGSSTYSQLFSGPQCMSMPKWAAFDWRMSFHSGLAYTCVVSSQSRDSQKIHVCRILLPLSWLWCHHVKIEGLVGWQVKLALASAKVAARDRKTGITALVLRGGRGIALLRRRFCLTHPTRTQICRGYNLQEDQYAPRKRNPSADDGKAARKYKLAACW